jgi:4-hydroxy-tetrahydrodipicolinate synthase
MSSRAGLVVPAREAPSLPSVPLEIQRWLVTAQGERCDMGAEVSLQGVYVPTVTPFTAEDRVDLDCLERLCHEYLDAGAAGIVALATTGEASALDEEERRAVVERCSRVCAERSAQLIVGAGTNNTAASVAAARSWAGTPAMVAILTVVPYYVRPSEEGIAAHVRAVAAASAVPVVIYNIPYRTGRVLGPRAMLELARDPGIAGVKQAVGSLDGDSLEILAGAPSGFHVLGGDDQFLLPLVLLGGSGAIAASAHVCTERFVAMIDGGLAGDVATARAHHEALLPVVRELFSLPSPSVLKGVLHAQGRIPTAGLRLPLVAAPGVAVAAALAAIDTA